MPGALLPDAGRLWPETSRERLKGDIPLDNLAGISGDPGCPSVSSEAHWLPHDSSYAYYDDKKNIF